LLLLVVGRTNIVLYIIIYIFINSKEVDMEEVSLINANFIPIRSDSFMGKPAHPLSLFAYTTSLSYD